MSSFAIIYIHVIFSTKFKEPLLTPEIEKVLKKYLAGIARNQGFNIIKSGGMPDHMHLLIQLPATMSLSKVMHLLKGSSSKWINDTYFQKDRGFRWQGGYSAFSVSQSILENVKKYIQNQKEHHQNYSFNEEQEALLNKHSVNLNKQRF
ncbi:MAG: IS200/IS605 family transposase [Balneolaceae bacterium]|nr:IS200/IS605 family transposase [Balneolaceae bacterium]